MEFENIVSQTNGTSTTFNFKKDSDGFNVSYSVTYNFMSMATAIAMKDKIVECVLDLKKEHDELSEIEIISTIEYVILSSCTDIQLKDVSVDKYFMYRAILPYDVIKHIDPNVKLVEETVKSAISSALSKDGDVMSTLLDMASQEMFNEVADKDGETDGK